MAAHSSILAWKIPWTEEPGRLQSMESLRARHDWATSLSLFTFMQWRRKWQPTPVFLPGESQGWGSLVIYRLWGRTESNTTEVTYQQQQQYLNKLLIFRKYFLGTTENPFCLYSVCSVYGIRRLGYGNKSPPDIHSLTRKLISHATCWQRPLLMVVILYPKL